MMKTPVGLVAAALAAAILLAAWFLVAAGTRGENRDTEVRILSPAK